MSFILTNIITIVGIVLAFVTAVIAIAISLAALLQQRAQRRGGSKYVLALSFGGLIKLTITQSGELLGDCCGTSTISQALPSTCRLSSTLPPCLACAILRASLS